MTRREKTERRQRSVAPQCIRSTQTPFSSRVRLLFILGLCIFGTLDSKGMSEARAESLLSEDQLFKQFIERATSAYKSNQYEAAIKHFEGALMVRSNPNIHWNLSVCFHKLGRFKEALFHANEYLTKGSPSQKMRAKVEGRKQEILMALQRSLLVEPKAEPLPQQMTATPPPKFPVRPQVIKPEQTQNELDRERSFQANLARSNPNRPMQETWTRPQAQVLQPAPREDWFSLYSQSVIWGSISAALLSSSVGLHLYGDSVWDNRPAGGGIDAQDARRGALLFSWIGDGCLALGVTSLALAIHSYVRTSQRSSDMACLKCSAPSDHILVSGGPTFRLLHTDQIHGEDVREQLHGGVFGWRLRF